MTTKRNIFLWVLPFLLTYTVQNPLFAQQRHAVKTKHSLVKIAKKSLAESAAQYRLLKTQLPLDRFPVTYYAGEQRLITSGSEPWVGGFYPGALLYVYEHSHDTVLYREALRKLAVLEKEQYNTTTHDLGFMMYCSFGNAHRIDPKPAYIDVLINSAKSLASRFDEKVGCIRSWDSDTARFMVIIDNMVNLELLFAATRFTGDSTFYNIAITHANTTMREHYRPDYSSHHLVIYNPSTGKPMKKQTVQGASDSSAWARGQAWGLYGFTLMYRETGDTRYLEHANHIAQFILNHPNLPSDHIPYWDFNATDIPNAPRDASAAAVVCSALLELTAYVAPKQRRQYAKAAETMLESLSSPTYRATVGTNGGFVLKHGVGNYPRNADIDVPLIYADYYYIEALHRYIKMGEPQG